MLLIDYNPEEYQDHMHRWAKWIEDQGETEIQKTRSTTQGARTKGSRPGQGIPKGYDTEVAINAAVNALGKNEKYVVHKRVLVAQFLTRVPTNEKAATLGLSPADFRRKMAEARKMIDQYMAGITNPLRYTFEARKPG
tara:strand:+ start:96 stop:509 length:414 start_codon:yes stop_codon:yes gene_type:complete